jgi:hypothetical protein
MVSRLALRAHLRIIVRVVFMCAAVAAATVSFARTATVFPGPVVTKGDQALGTTAESGGVELSASLPAGWQASDIPGPASVNGDTVYSDGAFVMSAAGAVDTWSDTDEFRYTFKPISGDVDIVARVPSIVGVDPWSRAGLMIRRSLDPAAAHASIFATSSNGVVFQHRTIDSWATYYTDGGAASGAVWLKLERRGDRVTAFRSSDGVLWAFVGDEVLPLPRDLYVGMALTSHAEGKLASATFDHVTMNGIQGNAPPLVSLTAPSSGATAKLGGSLGLAATASDPDGSVAAVDFLVDGTFLLSASSSQPYVATWTPVAAGTFTVTANARDNEGAIGTSNAANVTIEAAPSNPPPPQTRTLTFTPSPDHAIRVDFYRLEIFPSGGSTTGTPVLAQDLGKPTVIDGGISADVTALLTQLPPGSYVAVVGAVGAGGTGRSVPSPDFSR